MRRSTTARHDTSPIHDNAATCRCCGRSFQPCRSTARFCSDACRKRASRGAPTVPEKAGGALLSVTGTASPGSKNVTLRRKPLKLDPRIVPDEHWPDMYRVQRSDGSLSDRVNLTRAKDVLQAWGAQT
jgi:hypothetical protein